MMKKRFINIKQLYTQMKIIHFPQKLIFLSNIKEITVDTQKIVQILTAFLNIDKLISEN